jgi:periplasmic protein TonB
MFEDSTFESVGAIHTRTRGWMMATFALNGSILLALVMIPLFYPQMLPSLERAIPMEAPPPPIEPVQLQTAPASSPISIPQSSAPALQASTVISRSNPAPGAPDDSAPIDWRNLAGGANPLSGAGNPFGSQSNSNIRVTQPAPRAPASVSQGVMRGLLVFDPKPVYPPVAVAIHTQGAVVLEALISRTGSIENLRVVSGPPLLRQAALDAVRQWRYRPFLLNGQPVEVETTVNVVFTLN